MFSALAPKQLRIETTRALSEDAKRLSEKEDRD
jgi:hypothetical protein